MLGHFNQHVKSCSVTLYDRKLVIGMALALLPLTATLASPPRDPNAWLQCEPDELAPEIVTATPNPRPANELPIQAEAQHGESSPTQSLLEGNATVSRGDQRLHADRITLDRTANHAQADAGFTYSDPRLALRGKRAEVDLDTSTGWFADADYYFPGRNAQGHAAEVQVDQGQHESQMTDATYSTCPRGKETWKLRASEIDLNQTTERGTANHIWLEFKDTPVFYFPWLSFPINDERQSGFLFPRQGYSSETGFDLAVPYYWNIAPNQDMTITPRLMTDRGVLLGVEYRFLQPWQQGQLSFEYIPDDRRYDGARGSINITDRAAPLDNVYTDLRYEYVSDDSYIRDLSNNLSFLTPNYLERHLDARYFGDWWQGLVRVEGFQVLNPAVFATTGNPYERLPQLLFNGGWPTDSHGFSYQMRGELVNFQQTDMVTGLRLDLWPSVTWTAEQPWGYVKPQVGFRYTSYELDNTEPGANDAPSRALPVLSLDSGLIFDRPFQANWLGVTAGTQTLEPRLFYLYVPYRDQDNIPLFDSWQMDHDFNWLFRLNRFTGADRMGDANQLTAALTTRLIDGPSGQERLQASIGQIQYFADRLVTLYPDGPEETWDNSGLIAQGILNLSSRWTIQAGVNLQPASSDVQRTGFDLRYYANSRQLVNLSYLLDRYQADLSQGDQIHSVDVSALWPLNSQWRLVGRWNQALNVDRNLDTLAGLEYEDCCWAIRAVARQYRDTPTQVDSQSAFYFEFEFKGLSRVGSSLENVLRNSIFGYQTIRY